MEALAISRRVAAMYRGGFTSLYRTRLPVGLEGPVLTAHAMQPDPTNGRLKGI